MAMPDARHREFVRGPREPGDERGLLDGRHLAPVLDLTLFSRQRRIGRKGLSSHIRF
jgi:hypothetical protein